MLFAEAVTFDTGDVVAILAILALIGLVFVAGLAGFAYLIVTVTRGATRGDSANGVPGQPSSRPNSKRATIGICTTSAIAGVAVLWTLIGAASGVEAIYLPVAFATTGITVFLLSIVITRNKRR